MNIHNRKDLEDMFSRTNKSDECQDEIQDLRARLEAAENRAEENLSLLQRVQADFVNYRRRLEQEKDEQSNLGKAQLALKILPALDDFNLALANLPGNERLGKSVPTNEGAKGSVREVIGQDWVQGIGLIVRKLRSVLEAEGIVRIEAEGQEFNPWEHEAVLHVPSKHHPDGTVTEVVRDGYKMGNRVIRPAQVIVSKG